VTVAELIAKLQQMPQDAEVHWFDENEAYAGLYNVELEYDADEKFVALSGE
jgi:hypothetical protein